MLNVICWTQDAGLINFDVISMMLKIISICQAERDFFRTERLQNFTAYNFETVAARSCIIAARGMREVLEIARRNCKKRIVCIIIFPGAAGELQFYFMQNESSGVVKLVMYNVYKI